jgi:hypothetical protein
MMTEVQAEKVFLCTMNHSRYTPPHCRWVEIDDRGWVDSKTPVEDFGMYLILDHEITPNEAFEKFMGLLEEHEEGEE